MSKIKIRPATTNDLPFLKEIEISASTAFRLLPDYVSNERTVPPETLGEMLSAKKLWVAVNDKDRPIGFIGSRNMDDLFYVHEITVAHEFLKQGIGRCLMLAALNEAARRNYSTAGLTTRRDAPWNMPFYESLGFVELMDNKQWPTLFAQLQKEIAEGADPAIRCAVAKSLAINRQ